VLPNGFLFLISKLIIKDILKEVLELEMYIFD
jgi:hypothetical protein